ncbi:tubulin monoglycylase TTLL3 [Salarias fasciatus]|nr:tubulin monoglycylase TTLL3-like [Salarias fasciatus]
MYDLMSRLVRNETPYLFWTTRRDDIEYRNLQNEQMINHYANSGTFTTKVGLCVNLRNLQWFDTADPDTFFPRCYRLGAKDEKHAFIEDFRRTACTSLLQYVVEKRDRAEPEEEQSAKNGFHNSHHRPVGPEIIDMALRVCQDFLSGLNHADIDVTAETPPSVDEQQWENFLQKYYRIVHKGAQIRGSSAFVDCCKAMLAKLREVCPQLDTDGLNNIWIIKPGAKSRGRGIMCMNRLEEILALVDADRAVTKESKWVVQKYLECPFLVHGTKFDVRQWFLVTDWNPLTVWFYKECYLRFSTQPYSTHTLDSSVHLCNNSIQKHLQASRDRHPGVPEDNMWSCSQFWSFLQQQGRESEWKSVVVPGMQQAVVHALQTAQDLVEPRKASFELYGADFMLGRDLRPWLLEINASPTMACSTPVTAKLCPAVQVDTLRVVLDRRADPTAHTGGFQLIYKQAAVEVPQYVGVNLLVEGAPIRQPRPLLQRQTVVPNIPLSAQSVPERSSSQKRRQKSSGQRPEKVSVSRLSGKDNHEKKTTTAPKREDEMKTEIQDICGYSRSRRSATCEHPVLERTKPQRNAASCRSVNRSTLVPRTLSFSLSPPRSQSEQKPQSKCKPFLPTTTSGPQHKKRSRTFLSFQGRLPSLDVYHLQPNIVAGAAVRGDSHPGIHKHQSLQHKQMQRRMNKGTINRMQEDEEQREAQKSL